MAPGPTAAHALFDNALASDIDRQLSCIYRLINLLYEAKTCFEAM